MSIIGEGAPRFARLERLTREVGDLLREINDPDAGSAVDPGELAIAVYRLEQGIEDVRATLRAGMVR